MLNILLAKTSKEQRCKEEKSRLVFKAAWFSIVWYIILYFLCSFCLKALHSRPSCAKLCWLRIKVKAVLSSWVNGLSAPQNGKSGWGNPLRLKNDIYKKAQIFDLKKQAKSLILAPESSFYTDLNILMQWATIGKNRERTTDWIWPSNLELKSQVKWGKISTHAISQIFCQPPKYSFYTISLTLQ